MGPVSTLDLILLKDGSILAEVNLHTGLTRHGCCARVIESLGLLGFDECVDLEGYYTLT